MVMIDKADEVFSQYPFLNSLRAEWGSSIYKNMEETVSSLKDFHDETERRISSGDISDLQTYVNMISGNQIPLLAFEFEDIKENKGKGIMPEICRTAVQDVRAILARPQKQLVVSERPERIERAQRITPYSLRHLSAHSEYWRQVSLSGVSPDRIMTQVYEDSWITYENIFLRMVVDQMDEIICQESAKNSKRKNNRKQIREIATFRESGQNQDNYSDWHKGKICAELILPLLDSEANEKRYDEEETKEERTIRTARKVIQEVQESLFYKMLKKQPALPLPVKLTNVIMMDEHYNKVYKLWQHMNGIEELELCEKVEGGTDSRGDIYYTEYIAAMLAWAIQKAQVWKQTRYFGKIEQGIHKVALTADIDEFCITEDMVVEEDTSFILLKIGQKETSSIDIPKSYQKTVSQAVEQNEGFFSFDISNRTLTIQKPADLETSSRFLS